MSSISDKAVIQTKRLGENVTINEFAIIRPGAQIGNDVVIHPHAVVNENAVIGDGVEIFSGAVVGMRVKGDDNPAQDPDNDKRLIIGPNSTIGSQSILHYNIEIGPNSTIDNHCEIGYPTELAEGKPIIIGPDSKVRSHSTFYQGSTFGPGLITGHRVTVREKTVAGENFQIGTLCDIQGDCVIGDYVRFHSNVHVGKKTKIGNFVWVFPYVVFTNDPTPPSGDLIGSVVNDYASIATMSVILPGVVIGSHALIGAHSLVSKDVPEGMFAAGVPAKAIKPAAEIKLRDGSEEPAYPWTRHLHRGYPRGIVDEWEKDHRQ